MKPKVLVTRATFPQTLDFLREHFEVEDNQADVQFDPATLRARLADKVAVLTGAFDRVDESLLDASPRLRAVCNMLVGFNNIDLAACTARGVIVTNTPGVLDDTTADTGIALMLAAARGVAAADRYVRNGQWRGWNNELFLGQDVHHASLGIVGMGRIGRAVARRARGFEMQIAYHNRRRCDAAIEESLGARYLPLDELLSTSDFVCLTLPYSPEAHHMIGAQQIARMKPNAVLVNIARGGLVDEDALIDALRARRIFAAGLDVFEGEPAIREAFLELENVVLLPHIGSASRATRVGMAMLAARNCVAALAGERPPSILNPQVLGRG